MCTEVIMKIESDLVKLDCVNLKTTIIFGHKGSLNDQSKEHFNTTIQVCSKHVVYIWCTSNKPTDLYPTIRMDKQLPTVNWQGQAMGLLSICLNMRSCSIAFLQHEWSTEAAKENRIITPLTL